MTESMSTTRRRPVAALVALALLPVLLAAIVLGATRGAVQRTHQVEAAVVNLDEAVTVNGQVVPMGRQLAGKIVEDAADNVSWTLADEADAADGLKSGRYAVVVTIPRNFSAAATSFADADAARQGIIDVTTSPNTASLNVASARDAAKQATDSINAMLTGTYLKNIYVGFNSMGDQFTQLADGADKLDSGASDLADGAKQAADGAKAADSGIAQLADGAGQLAASSGQLNSGASGLASGVKKYTDGTATLVDGVGKLSGGLTEMSRQLGAASGMSPEQVGQLNQLKSGAQQVAGGAAGLSSGLGQYQGVLAQWTKGEQVPEQVVANANAAGKQAVNECRVQVDKQGAQIPAQLTSGLQTGLEQALPTALDQGLETALPTAIEQALGQALPTALGTGLEQGLQPAIKQGLDAALPTALQGGLEKALPSAIDQGLAQALPSALKPALGSALVPALTQALQGAGIPAEQVAAMAAAISPQVAQGVAAGVAQPVASGVSQGVSSGVAKAVASGVASGVSGPVASGVASGAAKPLAEGVAVGVVKPVAAGVAGPIAQGVADGVSKPVASGVAKGVGDGAGKALADQLGQACDPLGEAIPQAVLGGFSGGAQAASTALTTKDPKTGQTLVGGAAALADGAGQLSGGVTQLVDTLPAQVAGQLNQLKAGVDQLANGAAQAADGGRQLVAGGPQLDAGATQLSTGIQTYTGGVDQLSGGLSQASDGANQFAQGVSKLDEGASQLAAGTGEFAQGIKDGKSKLPTYSDAQQETLSTVVATPVVATASTGNPGLNSTTGLLLGLALWLGTLATFLVVKAAPRALITSSRSSLSLLTRTLGPALLVGAVQAVALTIAGAVVLRPSAGAVVGLGGLLLVASVAFTLVNHALAAALGWFGRVVSVLMAGGTLAWGLSGAVPGWVNAVAQASPVTPVVQAVRSITGGGTAVTAQVGALVAWAVVAFVVSIIAFGRRRQATARQLK